MYCVATATAAFVCLHFIPYRIPECSIRSKSFALCEQQPKIPSLYIYISGLFWSKSIFFQNKWFVRSTLYYQDGYYQVFLYQFIQHENSPSQSKHESIGHKGVLHIPQISTVTTVSPSNLLSVISRTLVGGGFALQRCRLSWDSFVS